MQHVLTCVLRQATPELMEQVGACEKSVVFACIYVCMLPYECYLHGPAAIVYDVV